MMLIRQHVDLLSHMDLSLSPFRTHIHTSQCSVHCVCVNFCRGLEILLKLSLHFKFSNTTKYLGILVGCFEKNIRYAKSFLKWYLLRYVLGDKSHHVRDEFIKTIIFGDYKLYYTFFILIIVNKYIHTG